MPTIADVRAKFPQWADLNDQNLLTIVHRNYYSDLRREDLAAALGVTEQPEGGQKAPTGGQFSSGLRRSFAEVPGLAAGAGAYLADVVGADGARDAMLGYSQRRMQQVAQDHAGDAQSFTDAWDGKTPFADWLANSAGYVAGQVLQSLVTGGLGALGARMLAKTGARQVAEQAAARTLAEGGTHEAAALAAAEAAKARLKTAGWVGAGATGFSHNLGQELGSIYPEAVDQAATEGRTLDGGDLTRVGLSGAAAAAVDTATDAIGAAKLFRGSGRAGGMARRMATEVPAGMAREGVTEAIQTGIEHYGAGKPIADAEGMRDIVDSAAVGAVGGGMAGAGTALHSRQQPGLADQSGPGLDVPTTTVDGLQIPQQPAEPPAQPTGAFGRAVQAGAEVGALGTPPLVDPDTGEIAPAAAPKPTPAPPPRRPRMQDSQPPVAPAAPAAPSPERPTILGPDDSQRATFGSEQEARDYITEVRRQPRNASVNSEPIQLEDGRWTLAKPGEPGHSKTEGTAQQVQQPVDRTPDDIVTQAGKPFATAGAARAKATQLGPEYHALPVVGGGFVIRKKGAGDVQQLQLTEGAAPPAAGMDPGAGDAGRAGPVGGVAPGGSDRAEAAPAQGVDAGVQPPVPVAAAGGTRRNAALTPQFDTLVDLAAHDGATSPANSHPQPTDGQKEAGNYRVGRVKLAGLDVSIENPQGSKRSGTAPDGKRWENTLTAHYGYVRGTLAGDGDHSDVFIRQGTPEDWAGTAYVIDQVDPKTGKFDEHKTVLGVDSEAEARELYLSNYEKGWNGLAAVTAMPVDQFAAWVRDGVKDKPAGDISQWKKTGPAPKPAPKRGRMTEGASDGGTTQTRSLSGRETVANLHRLAGDEGQVQQPQQRQLPSIRSEGDQGVQGLERELPGVSERRGSPPEQGTPTRSDRRRQGVRAEQHALGDPEGSAQEQGEQSSPVSQRQVDDRSGVGRTDGSPSPDNPDQAPTRLVSGARAVDADPDPVQALNDEPLTATPPATDSAPVPAPSPEAAAPAADKTRLTDAGAELVRNRRGKAKGLSWDDVADMNDTLKVAQVVKANVWPRPDYAKLAADGAPAWRLAVLKGIYDRIATAPVTRKAPTADDLRAYIETVHAVRDAVTAELDRVQKDHADLVWQQTVGSTPVDDAMRPRLLGMHVMNLRGAFRGEQVLAKVFPSDGTRFSTFSRSTEQGKENNRRALLVGANPLVQALQFNHAGFVRARELLNEGFPAKLEAWQKQYDVRATLMRDGDIPDSERTGEPQERFAVYQKGSRSMLAKGHPDGGFATREQAEAFAKSLLAKKREALPPSRGLDLAAATRTGPDWRAGRNVTAAEVMERFGFRGVNLGNYVKAKQAAAQAHLNHIFDAFSDLADLLGVPPQALSLGGSLGVAIGAQGSGKALAHFVPGVNEINVTRDSGAGALAHEWGHALDHYLAALHGEATAMQRKPYLSALAATLKDSGGLRPEMLAAMQAVMKALNDRPMTEAEARQYLQDQRELNDRRLERWTKEFSGYRDAKPDALRELAVKLRAGDLGAVRETGPFAVEENLAAYLEAAGFHLKRGDSGATVGSVIQLAYRLRDLADEATFLEKHVPQLDTDFQRASRAMDAKRQGEGYWSTAWEMFARGFETYVMDALRDRQRESLYLSGLVDSAMWQAWTAQTGRTIPYPAGAERLQMQQAFQALVDGIQTRQTPDGGVTMFSRRAPAPVRVPKAQIGAPLATLSRHPDYAAAKAGDRVAALRLARDLVTDDMVAALREQLAAQQSADDAPVIVLPVLAEEAAGRNMIPLAVADTLAERLGVPVTADIVQSTAPKRTALGGLDRLFAAPEFDGNVVAGAAYILVDDTITQGGTFASLASHVEQMGGRVAAVFALTGKGYSATIAQSPDSLRQLRERFPDLEADFRAATGYGFDALTESESRYLLAFKPADALGSRIAAIRDARGSAVDARAAGQAAAEPVKPAESGTATTDDGSPMSRGGAGQGVSMRDARAVVERIRTALPKAPPIYLHERTSQAPKELAAAIRAIRDGDSTVHAAFHDGAIHAFPANVDSIEELQRIIGHHEIRHYGMRSMLGPRLGPVMLAIYEGNAEVRRAADEKITQGLADSRVEAVEEALADWPADQVAALKGVPRLLAMLREWLRGLAVKLHRAGLDALAAAVDPKGWSDADVARFLWRAEDVSRTGARAYETTDTVFQRVWHGTPYRGIEKFSTDKVGTGEGAQAYGWGLYFTSKREIADYYRRTLTQGRPNFKDDAALAKFARVTNLADGAVDTLVDALRDYPNDPVAAASALRNSSKAASRPEYKKAYAQLADMVEAGEVTSPPAGQLYEVEIPDDEHMLLWDKPLSEQPKAVGEALEALHAREHDAYWSRYADMREAYGSARLWVAEGLGADTYQALSRYLGEDKAASEALASVGIKGIKYLDGASRADGDGSFNYVVFSGEDTAVQGAVFSRSPARQLAQTLTASVDRARDVQLPAGYLVGDFMNRSGKLSWWHKTVGTMFDLAQRSRPFRRVFDAGQQFLNDTSFYATEAANLAPTILPKLEAWKDIAKTPLTADDNKAIARPIFEGTLVWTRDPEGRPVRVQDLERDADAMQPEQQARVLLQAGQVTEGELKRWRATPLDIFNGAVRNRYREKFLKAGIVWTDAELRSQWGLTAKQVALYREFRAAVDRSLKDLAVSDMLRYGGDDVEEVRTAALQAKTADEAAVLLRDHLFAKAQEDLDRAELLNDTANAMIDKADKVKELAARGYAPLQRFGRFTVYVTEKTGEQLYFGMFETPAEASRMARRMRAAYPDAVIQQGTMSQEAHRLFAGITPETVELFGEMLGLESGAGGEANQAFQTYLRLTKSNRSAMKRLIERKGVLGFSEDAGRVLASFVYSNARQTAGNLNMGELTDAVDKIPQGQGELKDAALRLADYVRNPQEEAAGLRGLLFAQYLGGSVASAMMNLTQPLAVTFPYLSQWGGAKAAAAQVMAAAKDAARHRTGDARLDAALKRAEEEGIVAPQEVHQLMAQAMGQGVLKAGDGTRAGDAAARASNAWSKVSLAWGKVFSMAELANRRITFIAAYRTAVAQGLGDPAAFAADAINQTQFVYNKGNRPEWARGPIGATLFTFKTYSISYLELIHRMWSKGGPNGKKAALLALGVLFLMSGLDGLPFEDDLEDVLDGFMQRLGYAWDTRRAKREALTEWLGEGGAQFVLKGLSGLPGAPIDVSGRMGMGNLIPMTGLFTKKPDHARDVAEVFGPAGDLARRAGQAVAELSAGNVGRAVDQTLPTAARNVVKAWQMATTGQYRDERDRKVLDVDGMDAAFKALGWQPRDVARVQEATGMAQATIAQVKMRETELADQWARAVVDGDQDGVRAARQALADWNRQNPEAPIRISPAQIVKRVRAARLSKEERIAKTAPREIRQQIASELAGQR